MDKLIGMKMTHLDALELRLSNERNRMYLAKNESEKKLRAVWVSQIEKEIENEQNFLNNQKEPK